MGPYYDAISLMISRVPEPRRTPWTEFRGPALGRRPRWRPLRIAGWLRRHLPRTS